MTKNGNIDEAKEYLLKTIEYNKEDIEAYKLEKELEEAGLVVKIEYSENREENNGIILKQNIASGETVDEGTTIVLTVNKFAELKNGTVIINVKALTGFEDTHKETITEDGEEKVVEVKNEPKDVSFKVTVNGEQITRNSETVKENETAKKVSVSGKGTIEIKVTIDGATKPPYTMDLNKTTEMTIPE